jgi:uncharacterized DUF497 family protein
LLVVHTHIDMSDDEVVLIRTMSARTPTRREAARYRQGPSA